MKHSYQGEVLPHLYEDFVAKVLPHMYNTAKLPAFYDYSSGQGPGTFDLKLDITSVFECAPEYKPTSNRFVHFTSLRALNSILTEQGLRLYNLHNVEDAKEYSFIAKEFGVSDFLLEILKSRVFICSLCTSDVLESDDVQWFWENYGHGGAGCAIEFEIEDPLVSISHVKLANIQYRKPDFSSFLSANSEFELRHGKTTNLRDLIHLHACLHKSEDFKREREIRFFYEDGFAEPHLACEEAYPYGFDSNNGKTVSYYKVKFYNRSIGYPSIKIKRIQFGSRTKPGDLKHYEDHFTLLFIGMMNRLGVKDELPVFEVSPLMSSFH
jgi:hypothetical protein